MAQKRINQLDAISNNNQMLNTDIFVIDRINNGGTYKTYKINGQQIINGVLAAMPSQQPFAYILDTNTNSIKANYPSAIATGYYSYASGYTTVDGNYSFGHGYEIKVVGTNSAGLGGSNYTLNGDNSVVLGGDRNGDDYSDDDTVYVPNLNIRDKMFMVNSPDNDDTLEHILVRDSNGEVKYRDVNSIVGGGGGMISRTYIDLMSDKTGGELVPGTTYYINDRDIWLLALSENELSLAGQRKYKIVKNQYYTPDLSTNTKYLGMYGKTTYNKGNVPNSDASNVYYVIWGGKLWRRNTSGADIPGTDDEIIQSGWTISDLDDHYEDKIFDVLYDFDNDIIIEQSDNNGNIVRTDNQTHINITDWGNNGIKNNITGGIFNNYSNTINNNNIKQTISNNSNTGNINFNSNLGPIEHNSNTGNIEHNSNIGNIKNNNTNVKIITKNSNTGNIEHNSNIGNINFNSNNGNIKGNNNNGDISSNSNDGDIENNSNGGIIRDNSNNGFIFRNINGGVISSNSNNGDIENNSKVYNIFGNKNMGNISGNNNNGAISSNSNNGAISSNSNNGDIYQNTNSGEISVNTNTGGIFKNKNNGYIIGAVLVGDITGLGDPNYTLNYP